MARADLILKLVKAGAGGDNALFKKVVESLIAEERGKQHNVVAAQLEDALHSKNYPLQRQVNGDRKEYEKIESFLLRTIPKKNFYDIILNDENRTVISEMIEEHHRSELLRSYNLEPRNRVLLVGPPGNGKTSLAEGIAEQLMVPMYTIRYDGIVGSYLGETANRLKVMFDYIKTQECVLFFDEFDAIGKERGDIHETGEIKRVVSSLLLQIDSLPSYVVVIAATNHSELLDRAVWRRFQIKLQMDKPDKKMIEHWIFNFLQRSNLDVNLITSSLASRLVGLSFSEIEEFILDIQRKYILSLPEGNIDRIIKKSINQINHKFHISDG